LRGGIRYLLTGRHWHAKAQRNASHDDEGNCDKVPPHHDALLYSSHFQPRDAVALF
jgi:hypothetical protein